MNPIVRVEIKPELLSWARERAGYDTGALAHRFPKLAAREAVADIDREIDQLVYELYYVAPDEIPIVEGAQK
jgi:hypothetical protein